MTRRLRPVLEGMEARELLSVTAILALHRPVHLAMSGGGSGGSGNGGGGGTATGVDGGNGLVLGQGSPNQYIAPTGTPTARQVKQTQFRFVFSGSYVQTPGRYSDEATFVHIVGVGTSTYFLHGDIQLNAIVPTVSTRETAGTSSSFDRNNNSNSTFAFDLTGSSADVDKGGRPTLLNGVTDVNLSGGVFAESQSSATFQIHYFPDGKAHPKGYSQGRATVVIRGAAYTLGTGSILAGPISKTNSLDPAKALV